jgi:hypothetical protein
MNKKNIGLTFLMLLIFLGTSLAQSDRKGKSEKMDSIPVLVFSPGDSATIEPNAFFYYDNEKVVNGPNVWQLYDFSLQYYLVPHQEEPSVTHSDDWFSQQRLAEYLKTLSKEDLDAFVQTYLFTEEEIDQIGGEKKK